MIRRDNIYVGSVIECFEFNNYYIDRKEQELEPLRYLVLRSILFQKNENDLASDLLYQSPNYPILGMTSEDIVLQNSRVIYDAVSLEPLLRLCNYKEFLTYEEVEEIRRLFFARNFVYKNCQLFGLKKSRVIPIDDSLLEQPELIKKYLRIQKLFALFHKSDLVISRKKGFLPPEMGEKLMNHRDESTIIPFIKTNHFKPKYEVEGLILKR